MGPRGDYRIDLGRLKYILSLSVELEMPVLVHLNGGNWCDYLGENPLSLHDFLEKDRANVQWYHDNTVDSDDDPATEQGNEVFLTHSRYAETVVSYKRRNLTAAAAVLERFFRERPNLLVGVTTDSEVNMNTCEFLCHGREKVADYNPLVIREFREEMARAYEGDIERFNHRNGTVFKRFEEIDPPRDLQGPDGFWEEWTRFRTLLARNHVQALADWIRATGLPAEMVYTHQLPYEVCQGPSGRTLGCNDISTGVVDGAGLGINLLTGTAGEYSPRATNLSSRWGVTELADLYLQEETLILAELDAIYAQGARFIAPFYWAHRVNEDYFQGPDQLTYYMRQTRINNSPFERALREFANKFKR